MNLLKRVEIVIVDLLTDISIGVIGIYPVTVVIRYSGQLSLCIIAVINGFFPGLGSAGNIPHGVIGIAKTYGGKVPAGAHLCILHAGHQSCRRITAAACQISIVGRILGCRYRLHTAQAVSAGFCHVPGGVVPSGTVFFGVLLAEKGDICQQPSPMDYHGICQDIFWSL